MKKHFPLFLFVSFLFYTTIFSQPHFDTLSVCQVAKGVKHISIQEPDLPWTLNVLDVNLEEAVIKVEAAISQDKVTGHEKTSSMARRFNKDGHHVVGAINGGFFDGSGHDVGMQIREGEILTPNNNWSAIGFTKEKTPFIERLSLNSKVILKNGTSRKINSINKERETDQLIFYNSYFGSSTNTNKWGSEISLTPISGWLVNDTVICVVTAKEDLTGNMALSLGNAVLSGHGNSRDFLNSNVNIGDTVFIVHSITPAPDDVVTLLNGYPKIVKDGKNCALDCYADEGGSNSFATARHPRTAAGFSKDGKHLYMVTVDGRQKISVGMSLPELADFLVSIGVYRAVNLDGGGSTTMVVRNKIVNSPSDKGGERSVANCMMIVSEDTEEALSQIRLNTEYAKVFAGTDYHFTVGGFDEFFNSVSINSSNVSYSLSNNFGTITQQGLFTASNKATTGYVIAEYEGMKDSAYVIVNSIDKLNITPKIAVTDTTNKIQFKVDAFDVYGKKQNLTCSDYLWESTNSSVGTVDSLGKFTGISSGTTQIIVRWNTVADTATVDVELQKGKVLLNSFDKIEEWQLNGQNIDTVKSTIEIDTSDYTEGNSSIKLNYSFTYHTGLQHWAYLNTKIPVQGVPINFKIDVKNSDPYKHMVALIVTNNDNEEFALLTTGLNKEDLNFDTLTATLKNPVPLEKDNFFYYPITISKIAVLLSSNRVNGETYTGTLSFDNLRVNYTDSPLSVLQKGKPEMSFRLYQNYPNPFNPATTIEYSIPSARERIKSHVKLIIYDTLGREVTTLVNEIKSPGNYKVRFNGENLSSGIYYYRLTVGNFQASKKMILLK